ncbi:ABC transporter permease [Roseivirga sp.]|uniref:ABC transporter permease n=1 Tax=Roseivirga sp. TaxID=1964215 RepID=UPI002B26AC92|nr:ABC transporter permease [Roseivirga sp.]
MLRNYIKVAFRNLRRNKLYASLNILGLSIGLGSFFIIYLFLQNELAYDQFHEKKDRIYRVVQINTSDIGEEKQSGLTSALGPTAQGEIPEIEAFSRLENLPKSIVVKGVQDSVGRVESAAIDPGFLEFFDLDFVAGSVSSVLKTPNSMLINESKATQYFGSANNAMGKVVKVGRVDLIIDGVYKDLPNTTSIKAEIIALHTTVNGWRGENGFNQWNASYNDQTYFLLNKEAQISEVESKLNNLFKVNAISETRRLTLQPLADVHFSLDVRGPVTEKTDRQYIFIFTLVAAFILICSVFNYVSLALSQSIERTKEIGVRKVSGARNKELYTQFLIESVIQVFFSFLAAIILVELLLPQLESLIDRSLAISVFERPEFLVKGLVFSLIIAGLCSLYPAYLSTRLNVVKIFKNTSSNFSTKRLIGAVSIFQIVVFIVLICVSFTANRQMQFMRNENLGFDKDSQLVLNRFSREAVSKKVLLKNELLKVPGVLSATYATSIPSRVMGSMTFSDYDFRWNMFDVDPDYFKTMGMEIIHGRGFLPEDTDSSNLIIINTTAAEKLGFGNNAVGRTIEQNSTALTIVGVVNDFHFVSKKEPVEATLFKPLGAYTGVLVLKLDKENMVSVVENVKSKYSGLTSGDEATFFFLEDQINSQYKQENVMITMLNTFTVIAALVAFIGLFGIAGYSVKRRLKEMGIRKVLGAGFLSIQKTLNVSSVWKLLIAVAIAVPVVVYWMDNWLSSFAYRIEMPVFLIFGAIAVASVVIFITVSIHSVKAYLINPVEILKDE